ncbi:MAG: hypothetical protein ACK4G4_11760 [Thermus sp.]|uniref:hypothetical protein n=1 Tax=Thermus sp. TaxID=275 RepID=UPI003919FD2E
MARYIKLLMVLMASILGVGTIISDPNADGGYLAVPTGSVTLPDWTFPPGW